METTTIDPATGVVPAATETTQTPAAGSETTQAPAQVEDPFQVDDSTLAVLAPESRAAVEPIIKSLRDKAKAVLEKTKGEYEPHRKKAEALDKLVQNQQFVAWYQQQINPKPPAEPEKTELVEKAVSVDEWAATQGEPAKVQELIARQARVEARQAMIPEVNKLKQGQQKLAMGWEMDQLFRDHPDANELDKSGMMEPFLYFNTDLNKQPMKQAYSAAKKAAEYWFNKGKQEGIGIVQKNKNSVTETPSTSSVEGQTVVEVGSQDEALKMQIAEAMSGGKRKFIYKRK
jgi:hypothetical protein